MMTTTLAARIVHDQLKQALEDAPETTAVDELGESIIEQGGSPLSYFFHEVEMSIAEAKDTMFQRMVAGDPLLLLKESIDNHGLTKTVTKSTVSVVGGKEDGR